MDRLAQFLSLILISVLMSSPRLRAQSTSELDKLETVPSMQKASNPPGGLHSKCNPECAFGSLPGVFQVNASLGESWQLLGSSCQLKNYLQSYISPSSSPPPVGILFLSDSIDHFCLRFYCKMAEGQHEIVIHTHQTLEHANYNYCKANRSLSLGQMYLPTLTNTTNIYIGHSITGNYTTLEGYKSRTTHAQKVFREQNGGADPALVVIGGGLWDSMRWYNEREAWLAPEELMARRTRKVGPALQIWYREQVKECIKYIRSMFPKSKLVWRNFPTPDFDPQDGSLMNRALGPKTNMVQVSQVGMAAAIDEGLEIVNMNNMVLAFTTPKDYLFDFHHPNKNVTMEYLNVLLNIARRVESNDDNTNRR